MLLSGNSLNLDNLLIQLKAEVTPKWYEFGQAAGMEKMTLDEYSQYPEEECIVEVLDKWLRNHTGTPTWREVAEILRNIGLSRLGNDIDEVYTTGKKKYARYILIMVYYNLLS